MLHNNFFADEIGNMVVSARTGSHYIQQPVPISLFICIRRS